MKLTSFMLPEPLIKELRNKSRDKGISQAEIVRRALDNYFENVKKATNEKKKKVA